ncbi:MAG: hypothetical protein IT320_27850 [Anaerolineae bacterium]|nr:hypothetical protein [Anaerolineae bacterium]
MVVARAVADDIDILNVEINKLLSELGTGKVEGVAYDTAWVARLAPRYPGYGFEASLEWLRWNQHADGTWGAPLVHYHDRFVSTLAAIVALREAGTDSGDEIRIERGEAALWQLVGKLGRDDSDTVGFPIISTGLADDAAALGLDVPMPPIRYAGAYRKKVNALLNQPVRDWRSSPLSFSLEALRSVVSVNDRVLEPNDSVGVSPAATAGYLLAVDDQKALGYLKTLLDDLGTGAIPALAPIDSFEISWSINHLGNAHAIYPEMAEVRRVLKQLWGAWSPETGMSYATYLLVHEVDDTAAAYSALHWGGYSIDPNVFSYYEADNEFCTFPNESNPSVSVNVRVLQALKLSSNHPRRQQWIKKAIGALHLLDENGSFWWDKWHTSPYYVNSSAINILHGLDDDLVHTRLKWILRTQNADGGWGYMGVSTPEETAYCLEALMYWDRTVRRIDTAALEAAARFLRKHVHDSSYTPLWIGKSLYTPYHTVRAAILAALYSYMCRDQ